MYRVGHKKTEPLKFELITSSKSNVHMYYIMHANDV